MTIRTFFQRNKSKFSLSIIENHSQVPVNTISHHINPIEKRDLNPDCYAKLISEMWYLFNELESMLKTEDPTASCRPKIMTVQKVVKK